MKRALLLLTCLAAAPLAWGTDQEASRAKAVTVCAACHGATGISVGDAIPNLAAQRAGYLAQQLRAFKDGSRKSPVMNAMAAQLSTEDVAGLAAYFAAQVGAQAGARSALLPSMAATRVTFPERHKESFIRYHTINFPARKQVHHFYANKAALQAAKAGQPLPDGAVLLVEVYSVRLDFDDKPMMGSDGFLEAESLLAYSVMARDAGWGAEIPEMLRNDNWNYAAFAADGKPRAVNQAECLACHKPLDRSSYAFTLKELAGVR